MRPSIAFHLWVRLTVITLAFTVLGIGVFAWLQIDDNLSTARQQASAQAQAAALSFINSQGQRTVGPRKNVSATLGILMLAGLDDQGHELPSPGSPFVLGASIAGLALPEPGNTAAHDVKISDASIDAQPLNPIDLLSGGRFGAVHIVPVGAPAEERAALSSSGLANGQGPSYVMVVLEYEGIAREAQTLVVRSFALAAGILAVAAAAIWVLLDRFVTRPLDAYNATARRIAAGELARMPDLGSREFAQLGQTIDDMAETLRQEATIDPLTGLYNVRHLRANAGALLEDARRRGQPLSLLNIDLDNLKPINDSYGHRAGDIVLRTVGSCLQAWGADRFVSWRTGGDEFAAALPGIDAAEAEQAALELRQAIAEKQITVPGGEISVSVSVGRASYPEDGETIAALTSVADGRMYEAKALVHERSAA
jgi:diguanylate cyclase (GGDEF)-like protein